MAYNLGFYATFSQLTCSLQYKTNITNYYNHNYDVEQNKNDIDEKNDDWMYKPLLNTNTRTDYDGNRINEAWMT